MTQLPRFRLALALLLALALGVSVPASAQTDEGSGGQTTDQTTDSDADETSEEGEETDSGEGEAVEGEAVEGEAVEGEAVEGEAVEGEAGNPATGDDSLTDDQSIEGSEGVESADGLGPGDGGEAPEGDGDGDGDGDEAEEEEEEEGRIWGMGQMPDEAGGRRDPTIGISAPIPRREDDEAEWTTQVDRLEAALLVYEAEAREYHEDLERLVRVAYEERRTAILSIYRSEINGLREEERLLRLDALARLEAFVTRYPDHPPETPDALFRLAELYYEEDIESFRLADLMYVADLDRFDAGEISVLPEPPDRNFTLTIEMFQRLIHDFPDYRQIDGAYYLMAYAMLEMGEHGASTEAFLRLVRDYPESDFAQEGWVRIGERYFVTHHHDEAVAAYQHAVAYGEGRLFDEALFKLGWAHFLSNDYGDALEDFEQLVRYYEEGAEQDVAGALRDEALQYMAVILAEEDWDIDGERDIDAGMPRIRAALEEGEAWQVEVADKLGDAWYQTERYEEALDLYRYLVEQWPDDRLNPQRHERIVAALSRLGLFEEAFVEQGVMGSAYGPDSEWYRAQARFGNYQAMAYADELARVALLDSARWYNQTADNLRDLDRDDEALPYFEQAAAGYAEFLEAYPSDREAFEVRFLYAQALYSSDQYLAAAAEYGRVRDAQGSTEYQELAAFQTVRSLELALAELIDARQLPPYASPSYRGPRRAELAEAEAAEAAEPDSDEPRELPEPIEMAQASLDLIEAYEVYVELGLNSEDDPTTRGRFAFLAARTFFDHKDYEPARERFQVILENPDFRCQDESIFAASFLIESFQIEGDFEGMEVWGNRIRELDFCEGSMDMALIEDFMEEAETMRVGAIFQSAENLFLAEEYDQASEEYVRLVNQNPESEFAPAALNNAAVGYERLQRYEAAMRLYGRVVDEYPECEFVNNALYRVAVNSRRFFDFDRATNTYLRLSRQETDEERARQSLFAAGELQEWSRQYIGAAETFTEYVERFPEDPNAPLALYRAGLAFEAAHQFDRMLSAWEQLRREYGNWSSSVDVPIDGIVVDTLRRTAEYHGEVRGDLREAQRIYETVLQEFERRGPEEVDALFSAGQASFTLTQQHFDEWFQVEIEGSLAQQRRLVEQQIGEIPALLDGYSQIVSIGSAEWTMAAYYMLGRVYQAFADKLFAVPIPEFDDFVMEEAYVMELEAFAARFEDEAIANWELAFAVSRELGIVNEWSLRIVNELNRYLGDEFPVYREAQDFIQTQFVSPPGLSLPGVEIWDDFGLDSGGRDSDGRDSGGIEDIDGDPFEPIDDLRPPAFEMQPLRDTGEPPQEQEDGFQDI